MQNNRVCKQCNALGLAALSASARALQSIVRLGAEVQHTWPHAADVPSELPPPPLLPLLSLSPSPSLPPLVRAGALLDGLHWL